MNDLNIIQKNLDYKFKNLGLLQKALTHKSYRKSKDNERLEFLGDAVLDLIIAEYLYTRFSDSSEGILSKMRASLVSEEAFAKIALFINLGSFLYISPAEENNKGREKPSLLANAFEAVIGAIYLEAGIKIAKKKVLPLVKKCFPDIDIKILLKDYKTFLQEKTQEFFSSIPEYKLISSDGPDHQKNFEIAVYIENKEFARAKGKSKKIAQQNSAKIALEKLNKGNNA